MAQWELTSKLGPFLDRHLVIPLLEFLSVNGKEIYDETDLLRGKLELLSGTNMIDFAMDIHKELEEKGISIERTAIKLERPLKRSGKSEVEIKLHSEVTATLTVTGIAEPTVCANSSRARFTFPKAPAALSL